MLDDIRLHVKVKLSALWVSLMLCYIYGDIFRLFQHNALQEMLDGKMWGTPVTQWLLVGTSIVIAIPALMVFLSLVLKPALNRWLNIILSVFYIALMIFTMQGAWLYYKFLGVIEILLSSLIIWYAWTWPKGKSV